MNLSISYYVTPSKKDQWPITALLSYGEKVFDLSHGKSSYKPMKFATGIYVHKDDWNDGKKIPISRGKLSEVGTMEERVKAIFKYLVDSNEFTREVFKWELDSKIRGKQKQEVVKRVRFVDFIENEIKPFTSSSKTRANYTTLSNKLLAFEKSLGRPLYSNEFDEEIYILFMEKVRQDENVKKINTVWSIFKDLRATINKIIKKYKIEIFRPSDASKEEQVKPEVPEKAYLSWEQIQQVIQYEPTELELKNAKVMFLTLVFSGCRIGDIYKVVPEYTYNDKGVKFQYARFITDKGKGTEVIIPILKPLMDAIKENGGQTAKRVPDYVFNAQVKQLMKGAGFTQIEKYSYTDKHNCLKFETAPLHDFISSHTGRRSFITNLINFIPEPMLTKITTHKTTNRNVMYSYNKISLLQNAAYFVRELKRLREAYEDSLLFDLV
jgi:integrase